MLSKLMKYEFKVTSRTFLPFYVVLLAVAVVNRLVQLIRPEYQFSMTSDFQNTLATIWSIVQVIVGLLLFMVITGVFILTLYIVIQRFYKNLLTDEGYLMFTLPVKPHEHIISKLTAAIVWLIVSSIVAFVAITIVVADQYYFQHILTFFSEFFQSCYELFGGGTPVLIFEGILAAVLSIMASILEIYAAICIGQLFNRHKIVGAFGAYFAISMALQLLSIPFFLVVSSEPFGDFIMGMSAIQLAHTILCSILVGNLILSAGFFFGSNYVLKNRLNLE